MICYRASLFSLPFKLVMLATIAMLVSEQPLLAAEQPATGPMPVARDSQEYFLLQSFHANRPQPLNHLGLIAQAGVGGYRVSAVLDGFPAQQAGLRRGDLLISIDGAPFHPVLSLNPQIGDGEIPTVLDQEVALEYGRNGSATTLSLQPVFGSLFDAYRTATLASVQQFSNGNKLIGYVKLWSLDRSTNGIQGFHQLLDSLSHCDGLVLDLRDSYGFIDANHIDRFFSSRNSLFELSEAHNDLWQRRQPERLPMRAYGRAMTVIQNNGTRGGLELFAHQLASLQRVVSIGETTSGKAGQVSFNENSGSLSYRPHPDVLINGQQLEAVGIAAEVPTPYPLDDSLPVDPQLDAAVLALMEII